MELLLDDFHFFQLSVNFTDCRFPEKYVRSWELTYLLQSVIFRLSPGGSLAYFSLLDGMYTPRKLICNLKKDHFKRKIDLQPSFLRDYVSFWGEYTPETEHDNGKPIIWRCICYWKLPRLVFGGNTSILCLFLWRTFQRIRFQAFGNGSFGQVLFGLAKKFDEHRGGKKGFTCWKRSMEMRGVWEHLYLGSTLQPRMPVTNMKV